MWWVREKSISLILERAICPVDPDSPLKEQKEAKVTKVEAKVTKVNKSAERSKKKGLKKGLPVYSPHLFALKSPRKAKSPGKSPITPKHLKRERSEIEPSIIEGSPASKLHKSARRHVVFTEEHEKESTNINVPLEVEKETSQ